MKRSFILSLCAVALAAITMSAAQATVDVALNLTYTQPADPSQGGTWSLVAKTDTALSNGIVGLSVRLTNMPAAGTVNASIGHEINGGLLQVGTFGLETEFVYGQNLGDATPLPVTGVGQSAATDQFFNPVWDGVTEIASGTIADLTTRPAFGAVAANEDIGGVITAATIGLTNIRGDSVGVDGLPIGDLDRNGNVDLFGDTLTALGNVGTVGATWGQGDINASGDVDLFGDTLTILGNVGATWTPVPPIAAVPEPAGLAMVMIAGVSLLAARRRVG